MSIGPETISAEVILAKQEELAKAPGPAEGLGELEIDQDVASGPGDSELSPGAKAARELFEVDTKVFHEKSLEAFRTFSERMPEVILPEPEVDSRDFHIFGPDVDGTGGPHKYAYQWTHVDSMGAHAYADARKGTFGVYDYTTGGPASWGVAQVGVQLKPAMPSCKLSIRPYVLWSGYSTLRHRVYDPNVPETRWGFALGSTGITVQSWNESGGGFFADTEHWVDHWSRHEANPSGTIEYEGTDTVLTGLQAEVFASGSRRYTIWATCRVCVVADPGFAVATRSTSVIDCTMPFLVVEETAL
jgi:hypothetical protein